MQRQHISQTGFSLVELMVALVLGVILMGGVISVYISSKASYNTNNSLGEVEQGGRYALDFMDPILTLAGYAGCSRPSSSKQGTGASAANLADSIISGVTSTNPITPVYNFGSTVFGYEASGTNIGQSIPTSGSGVQTATTAPVPPQSAGDWTPSLTWQDTGSILYNAIKSTALEYSDILMVHEALKNPATLVTPYADNSALYVTPSTTTDVPATAANFNAKEFAIESGCFGNTTVPYTFQITGVTGSSGTLTYSGAATPGNSGSLLNTAGGTNYVQVQPVNTYVFYVGEGQDGWPALFEASFGTSGSTAGTFQTEQLVSGVENMQVLYGVDILNGDQIPDYFQTADAVQSDGGGANAGGYWGNVVAVRIAMVVESDNFSVDKAPTSSTNIYMLGAGSSDSVTFTPPQDQRLRRYFIQTFSFRNLLP